MADSFKQGKRQPESSDWKRYQKNLDGYSDANKFISGGRIVIKINGVIAPRLSSIGWKIATEQLSIREIDNYSVHELSPKDIEIAGTYSEFREPFLGPTMVSHQATALSFMFHPYISIEVRDNLTGALLLFAGKAAITNRSETVNTESLVVTTIQWKAIAWKDEMEPVIPFENSTFGPDSPLQQVGQNPLTSAVDGIAGIPISGGVGVLKKFF